MFLPMDILGGRRVLILGFGRQGQALARWLPTVGAFPIVADSKSAEALGVDPASYKGTRFALGEDGEHPEVLLEVARTLATRLDNLTGHLVDVKRQYGGDGGHLGMLDEVLSTLMHHQGRQVSPGSARLPEPEY